MRNSPRQRNKVSDRLSDTHFHEMLCNVPVTHTVEIK